jgi:hypothetical protein
MAKPPWYEKHADHLDRNLVRDFGDQDARLRILRRRAKSRELERLERLDRQAEAQTASPPAVPDQPPEAAQAAVREKRRPRSHDPAPTTRAAVRALTAFKELHPEFNGRMSARAFAKAAASYASELGLPGADDLDHESGTMRTLAGDILEALHLAYEAQARNPRR